MLKFLKRHGSVVLPILAVILLSGATVFGQQEMSKRVIEPGTYLGVQMIWRGGGNEGSTVRGSIIDTLTGAKSDTSEGTFFAMGADSMFMEIEQILNVTGDSLIIFHQRSYGGNVWTTVDTIKTMTTAAADSIIALVPQTFNSPKNRLILKHANGGATDSVSVRMSIHIFWENDD